MQPIHVSAEESLRGSHSESSATHLLILSTTAIPTIPKSCPGWVCPTQTLQYVLLRLLPFGFALSHCHQSDATRAAVPTDWRQCDIMTYRKWCYIWLYLPSRSVWIIQILNFLLASTWKSNELGVCELQRLHGSFQKKLIEQKTYATAMYSPAGL